MDTGDRISKTDPVFATLLILFILLPIAVLAVCVAVSFAIEVSDPVLISLIFGPFIFGFLWWFYGGKWIHKQNVKKTGRQVAELAASGFVTNYVYNGACVVRVDMVHRKVALQFCLNPSHCYVVPAEQITRAWVEEGKRGKWIFEGTRKVSFLLMVNGVKVRVPTFVAPQRYSMVSDEVLTGISKADVMVEAIDKIRRQVP